MTELSLNRLTERAVSAGTGCVLVGAVAVMDDSVRQRLTGLFTGSAPAELAFANAYMQRGLRMATEMIGFQGDHVSPGMFLIAAAVFVVLMLTQLRS
jgi:uncharacterized membrane protein